MKRILRVLVIGFALVTAPVYAQAPVTYHLSFPEAHHHRMQVDVTFPDVPPATLQVMMSSTSPGRYAVHEFAKNVFDVRVEDGAGGPLKYERPNPSQWDVAGHGGFVRVRYKVFGDRVDGTFLGIDGTHAHVNIPAALMWARGLEARPVRVTFDAPPGWKVATQLHATGDPRTFTAPNLQYLVDSPAELSDHTLRTFRVDREFRVALHHQGTDAEADAFSAAIEKIVREERAIFGELPAFETPYTFIADLLPYVVFDAMEHRNSTILTNATSPGVSDQLMGILSTAAHEFFHVWNVERIRPRSLEPFKLDAPNPSGELWFAEGFTNYYESLTMHRAGLWPIDRLTANLGSTLDAVIRSPGRKYRSAEEMSLLAQFVDQAAWADPVYNVNTFLSYYTWGAAIGLGLDLSLRERTDHKVTLDDYMRRMWRDFGRAEPASQGAVARPYTMQDLRRVLADVSGDTAFANQFFDRYIQGRDVVDYSRLLARAGLALQKSRPGHPWIGPLALEFSERSALITAPTIEDTPVYRAGLDRGDELLSVNGVTMSGTLLEGAVGRLRPGDTMRATIRRRGVAQDVTIEVGEDPRLHIVPVESKGREVTPAERAFREAWLRSRQ